MGADRHKGGNLRIFGHWFYVRTLNTGTGNIYTLLILTLFIPGHKEITNHHYTSLQLILSVVEESTK